MAGFILYESGVVLLYFLFPKICSTISREGMTSVPGQKLKLVYCRVM